MIGLVKPLHSDFRNPLGLPYLIYLLQIHFLCNRSPNKSNSPIVKTEENCLRREKQDGLAVF